MIADSSEKLILLMTAFSKTSAPINATVQQSDVRIILFVHKNIVSNDGNKKWSAVFEVVVLYNKIMTGNKIDIDWIEILSAIKSTIITA